MPSRTMQAIRRTRTEMKTKKTKGKTPVMKRKRLKLTQEPAEDAALSDNDMGKVTGGYPTDPHNALSKLLPQEPISGIPQEPLRIFATSRAIGLLKRKVARDF